MEQRYIRNFAIIAHIDHGKSTLSDRFLEITGTIRTEALTKQEQFLDQNPISRERGITIKLAPVRMHYSYEGNVYQLNLIDTPGHIDFSYEVSRTLVACEGAILLVDATKGVQAQTLAHLREAQKARLTIIPVINKIDMENARVKVVEKQLEGLGFAKEAILHISAKTGQGVVTLLQNVIETVPAPKGEAIKPFRAIIFDAVYDEHRGVIACVRVLDGEVKQNNPLELFQTHQKTNAQDVGYFTPGLVPATKLSSGEIGYIVTGIKTIRQCRVGDTIFLARTTIAPFPGYKTPKPMVFFGVYPKATDDFVPLREAFNQLALIDASLTFHEEYSSFLGSGFRAGFLGLLHAEIFKERLKQEFQLDPLFTIPQVVYEKTELGSYKEPYIHLTIHVPQLYLGGTMALCQRQRGILFSVDYQDDTVVLQYDMPYSTFLKGFASEIKSISSGFASIDYDLTDYKEADLEKLEVRINDTPIDVLSEFVYRDEAVAVGRKKAEKLKVALPRQQVKQVIQCYSGSHIIAREEIPPYRKDVLAKMSGGDRTRKDKLLEAQKKGKAKMMTISKIEIPQKALFDLVAS
ncbi:MAG TPA: GTP-binding protein [Patescibacteria group bacterium]|nr:GTP-binding protein [Patescibacteria group bacterium]